MTQGVRESRGAALQKRYERLSATLRAHDQMHLLAFYDELDEGDKETLLGELEAQDWDELAGLIGTYVLNEPDAALPENVAPAPYYPRTPTRELKAKYKEARALGETLLREGQVAAFTVAGGQGTRLGWDGPKGTFPATPLRKTPLFGVFAEYLRKVGEKYGATPPWYLMTSPINDAATRAFFEEHDYFGLDRADVTFFSQGTMPSVGLDGKVLLAEKNRLASSPDGHGGSLKALARSGALSDMAARGVTQISYFQVDNPNVKCLDPLFIGLHALDGAEMSSKMLPKVSPSEKVGNFALLDGRVGVIEYSDIPAELAEARDEAGELRFRAGSIAIHMISLPFVRRLSEGGAFALPFHRAVKKVPYVDPATGEWVEPGAPNAVKLEMFVFDALPLAEKSIILETDRVEEFAPIKNATGDDSPATSRQLQSERAARWLEQNGVNVPHKGEDLNAVVELRPVTAIEPDDLAGVTLPEGLEPGGELLL